MKKTRRLSFLVALATFAAITVLTVGCAAIQESVQRTGSLVISGLPRVEFPILAQIGITPTGQNLIVGNGTPFYGRIVAYGKELARIPPGGEMIANRYYEPLYQQTPVVVAFYRDEALTEYVGVVARTFSFGPGQPGSASLMIRAGDIQTPEGFYSIAALGFNYPQPDTSQPAVVVDLPREPYNGTTAVQVVNNTLFTMTPAFDGGGRIMLPPGATYYVKVTEILGASRQMTGQMVFTDRGRLVGAYDYVFGTTSNGVVVYQVIASPQMIRR